MLPLLRQRSREVPLTATAAAAQPNELAATELLACAAARRVKDFEQCLVSARAALRKDEACGKAWAFLCWALFELRMYDEASRMTRRAITYRTWSLREREGMAALRTSCRLLSYLTPAPGDQLRDSWYRKRLRALWESDALFKYEVIERFRADGRKGATRYELSLLDHVPAGGLRDVTLGGDGGERDVPSGLLEGGNSQDTRKPLAACFEGDKFPLEQALGGVVYLKSAILPFHCDQRIGPGLAHTGNRRQCYVADGPCWRCASEFPVPTHRFPTWDPTPPVGATLVAPHPEMDVVYSRDAVSPSLHAQLSSSLERLSKRQGFSPMPQYHNIIDPNVNSVDGLWVPTEFEVGELDSAALEVVCALELACIAATGERLPFGFGTHIATLANEGTKRAECHLTSPIPGLDVHEHVKLHVATQRLMATALPMLARLRRPALLLPGPLQAVVKAQRIVLAAGEEYAGVWHEDGMDEHVVAVVLYYYRASPSLQGGSLEFCSKQQHALWCGDAGGEYGTLENTAELASTLPRCRVPVREGTLVCFSNYAAVHRVLRIEAESGGGSRDFMAFFVIDQRHPLPTPRVLPPRDERMHAARTLLAKQLQPRGSFGFDSASVYSTGNGSVADVGWMSGGGDGGGNVADSYPDAASLIQRLNIAPPHIERGVSMALQAPPPRDDEVVEYNAQSGWAEVWLGDGAESLAVYLDLSWGNGITAEPPADGIGSVLAFADERDFARYVCDHGYWYDDAVLEARMQRTAVELVVERRSYYVLREQLQRVERLCALEEGGRCEVEAYLAHAREAGAAEDARAATEADEPFKPSAWPHVVEYLRTSRLTPHEEFFNAGEYLRRRIQQRCLSQLFDIQVNARALGFRALFKAVEAAQNEVRSGERTSSISLS